MAVHDRGHHPAGKIASMDGHVAALISNSMMRLLPRSVLLHFVLDECVRVSRRRCASGCGSLHADGRRSAGGVILSDCTRVVSKCQQL